LSLHNITEHAKIVWSYNKQLFAYQVKLLADKNGKKACELWPKTAPLMGRMNGVNKNWKVFLAQSVVVITHA